MSKNIFRVFTPKGAGTQEDRKEKRRAQLRQAQQTYRERKDRYTKALEREVAQGRAREAYLQQENAQLHASLQQLQTALWQAQSRPHDVDLGSPPWHVNEMNELDELHGMHGLHGLQDLRLQEPHQHQNQHQHQHEHRHQHVDPYFATANSAATGFSSASPSSTGQAFSAASPATTTTTPRTDVSPQAGIRVGDLDPTDVGMEFVLTLEEPCLGHLHGSPDNPEESNNHALTVSCKLLDLAARAAAAAGAGAGTAAPGAAPRAIPPPAATAPAAAAAAAAAGGRAGDAAAAAASSLPCVSYKTAPKSILESMLALSSVLCEPDSGALTPVQAWNSVRSQPQFANLDFGSLKALAVKLRDTVRCDGFGAVVDKDVFNNQMLWAMLSPSL